MKKSLDVTEILMKHWGQVEWLRGYAFSYKEGLKDVESIDIIRKEVLATEIVMSYTMLPFLIL